MINEINKIANSIDLPLWLDMGTLLGFVREGQIIAWDNDIDLATYSTDIKTKYNKFERLLNENNYIVKNNGMNIKVTSKENHEDEVSIHIYWLNKNSYKYLSSFKRFRKNQRLYDILKKIIKAKIDNSRQNNFSKKFLVKLLPDWLIINLISLFCTPYYLVNKKYVTELIEMEFISGTFSVPKYPEQYLETFYGESWRIPDKDWHHGKYLNLSKPKLMDLF